MRRPSVVHEDSVRLQKQQDTVRPRNIGTWMNSGLSDSRVFDRKSVRNCCEPQPMANPQRIQSEGESGVTPRREWQ